MRIIADKVWKGSSAVPSTEQVFNKRTFSFHTLLVGRQKNGAASLRKSLEKSGRASKG